MSTERCSRCDGPMFHPCVCGHYHMQVCDCGCTEFVPDDGTDGPDDYTSPAMTALKGPQQPSQSNIRVTNR